MLDNYEFWFITGSQNLYGEEVLKAVQSHAAEMSAFWNESGKLPVKIVNKGIVTQTREVTALIKEANFNDKCAGIITWMHTFSPSKMWINGLGELNKPMLHINTQFNDKIPFESIDMDFMNLNQSAHGDREHGFIGARLKLRRSVAAGYYKDETLIEKIAKYMRSAVGVAFAKNLNLVRFGDNMRYVAVTEGDKVEAQKVLGFEVNTYGIGDLIGYVEKVTDEEAEKLYSEYEEKYVIDSDNKEAILYQAKIEIALERFLGEKNAKAFTTTFEDLQQMRQLPGLACQRLMEKGYGFGGEGDWKISALTAIMKEMAQGKNGGTSFMEDYTYHFDGKDSLALGSHMLEVCPSVAQGAVKIQVHPLGIGGRQDPARMVFNGKQGDAIVATLIDMGGRMRLIVNDIKAVKMPADMPKLPVAQVMWKPMPDLETSAECWIIAGGAHHSVLSFDLTADIMRDFANFLDIEFVHIHQNSDPTALQRELALSDLLFKMSK